MYFSYDHLQLRYEPFPIGIARPLMDDALYGELLDSYPDIVLFESHAEYGKAGKKYALTEKLNPKKYYQFIKSTPIWRDFHDWVTRGNFIRNTVMALKERDVDLGYEFPDRFEYLKRRMKDIRNGRFCSSQPPLSARFEFSALPANGGQVVPHTDATRKLITLVVSMVRENDWNSAYGGGTDANRPKNPRLNYNYGNSHAEFEDMEVIDTFEFMPNQAVLFVKTFNSWHSVRPMTGTNSDALRKTLTINIMKKY
jgi:hypothetical protein